MISLLVLNFNIDPSFAPNINEGYNVDKEKAGWNIDNDICKSLTSVTYSFFRKKYL